MLRSVPIGTSMFGPMNADTSTPPWFACLMARAPYIKTIRGTMTSWKSRRSELDAWAAAFPKRPRTPLTRLDLATQLDLWARRGVAVRTLNKRRDALIQLYTALDGPPRRTSRERRSRSGSPIGRSGPSPTTT